MNKRTTTKRSMTKEGERRYQRWSRKFETNNRLKKIYGEESAKLELWLQLAEARHAAGLTQIDVAKRLGVSQAQIARMEKRGYEVYTLTSLRRYLQALGKGYSLQVQVRIPQKEKAVGQISSAY